MARTIPWRYADYGDNSSLTGVATPETYGAAGDGIALDTAAFYTAANNCQRLVLTPGKVYKIPGFKMRNGLTIEAAGGTDYTSIHPYILPKLLGDPNLAVCVLDLSNQGDPNYGRANTLRGVVIDGIDQSINGISAGSSHLTAYDVYITNCSNGLGGAAPAGSSYTRAAVLNNITVTSSVVGIRDFIDSRISSPLLASNGTNMKATSGANHWQVNGGRMEWAQTGFNVQLDASGASAPLEHISFNGTEFDRGWFAGAYLNNANHVRFNGCQHHRAGASNSGLINQRANIHIENCMDIAILSPNTIHAFDDGGGGADTPMYFIEYNGINTNCSIIGGDVSNGYTVIPIHYQSGLSSASMPGHKIVGVGGLEDYNQSSYVKYDGQGIPYQSKAALNVNSLPHGGSANATVSLSQYPIATFDRNTVRIMVTVRGATSGNTRTAIFNVSTKREAAAASMDASIGYGEVGTSAAIAFSPNVASLAQLLIQNVSTDGSTFDINVTNKSATEDIAIKIVVM